MNSCVNLWEYYRRIDNLIFEKFIYRGWWVYCGVLIGK